MSPVTTNSPDVSELKNQINSARGVEFRGAMSWITDGAVPVRLLLRSCCESEKEGQPVARSTLFTFVRARRSGGSEPLRLVSRRQDILFKDVLISAEKSLSNYYEFTGKTFKVTKLSRSTTRSSQIKAGGRTPILFLLQTRIKKIQFDNLSPTLWKPSF